MGYSFPLRDHSLPKVESLCSAGLISGFSSVACSRTTLAMEALRSRLLLPHTMADVDSSFSRSCAPRLFRLAPIATARAEFASPIGIDASNLVLTYIDEAFAAAVRAGVVGFIVMVFVAHARLISITQTAIVITSSDIVRSCNDVMRAP